MGQLIQTRTALNDLDAIWDYMAESSPLRASRYIKKIRSKLILLADNPLIGRARPDLAEGIRHFPVGNHLVFYTPIEDGIIVVRVRHQREDIDDLYG